MEEVGAPLSKSERSRAGGEGEGEGEGEGDGSDVLQLIRALGKKIVDRAGDCRRIFNDEKFWEDVATAANQRKSMPNADAEAQTSLMLQPKNPNPHGPGGANPQRNVSMRQKQRQLLRRSSSQSDPGFNWGRQGRAQSPAIPDPDREGECGGENDKELATAMLELANTLEGMQMSKMHLVWKIQERKGESAKDFEDGMLKMEKQRRELEGGMLKMERQRRELDMFSDELEDWVIKLEQRNREFVQVLDSWMLNMKTRRQAILDPDREGESGGENHNEVVTTMLKFADTLEGARMSKTPLIRKTQERKGEPAKDFEDEMLKMEKQRRELEMGMLKMEKQRRELDKFSDELEDWVIKLGQRSRQFVQEMDSCMLSIKCWSGEFAQGINSGMKRQKITGYSEGDA